MRFGEKLRELRKAIEQVLGLDFDWDEIEEMPGLYRSTIRHEAGHYDIDIDRAKLLHPTLPGMANQRVPDPFRPTRSLR